MKKNKNTLSIMEAVKQKAQEAKIETKSSQAEYISVIDYTEYELEVKEKEQLIKFEEKAIHHANEISKNTFELSKIFAEAQNLLSNHSGGTFKKWFEKLGFKKDFVYMCLKRNELFLELADNRVFEIPERAVRTISKIKNKINIEDVKEIIEADKPFDKAKEKEARLSGYPTTEIEKKESEKEVRLSGSPTTEIEKIELEKEVSLSDCPTNEIEIKEENEIIKLKKEISLKEKELKELKKQLREKESLEENKNNLTIDFKPLLSTKELLFLRNKDIEINLDDYLLVDDLKINRWFDDALLNGLDIKDQLKDYIVTEKNIEERIEHYKKIAEL